jgi:NodT family efflux transporter outer membrane factor (OMF) lipoprotein
MAAVSCSVSRNNQLPPDVPLPKSFDSIAVSYDTTSIADLPWQSFFPDTVLQRLIARGLANNFDLQLALKRIDLAQQEVQLAKAAYGPTLNLRVAAQTTRPSDNSLNGKTASSFLGKNHIEDYTAGVDLSWEADIWGKIRQRKEATLASYLQTYEGARAVQTRLIVSIAEGYYNLLMLEDQLKTTRKNLELADNVWKITQLQRDAGEVTTLALQQARVQQQSTALLIPQLEQSKALQQNALQLLVGELPGEVAHAEGLDVFNLPETLPTGLPARIVQLRPDVRASAMALKAANAQVGIAQANMYPSLVITASGGLNSFKASNWFNIPGSLFGLVGGSLTQPVLQRRLLKTQLAEAKINREQAVIQFRQSVVTAAGEVADALVKINRLKEQQVITKAKTDTLQQAISNAQLLFQSGMANYLEVITAQSNVLQSELDLADIKRQQLSAVVELYRALGGGWK